MAVNKEGMNAFILHRLIEVDGAMRNMQIKVEIMSNHVTVIDKRTGAMQAFVENTPANTLLQITEKIAHLEREIEITNHLAANLEDDVSDIRSETLYNQQKVDEQDAQVTALSSDIVEMRDRLNILEFEAKQKDNSIKALIAEVLLMKQRIHEIKDNHTKHASSTGVDAMQIVNMTLTEKLRNEVATLRKMIIDANADGTVMEGIVARSKAFFDVLEHRAAEAADIINDMDNNVHDMIIAQHTDWLSMIHERMNVNTDLQKWLFYKFVEHLELSRGVPSQAQFGMFGPNQSHPQYLLTHARNQAFLLERALQASNNLPTVGDHPVLALTSPFGSAVPQLSNPNFESSFSSSTGVIHMI